MFERTDFSVANETAKLGNWDPFFLLITASTAATTSSSAFSAWAAESTAEGSTVASRSPPAPLSAMIAKLGLVCGGDVVFGGGEQR